MTEQQAPPRGDRYKRLPPPVPREKLIVGLAQDLHEEWDDAFRETTWFLKAAG